MSDSISRYDITPRDLAKGRNLKISAAATPIVLSIVPFVLTMVLVIFLAGSPPVAATILFLGAVITAVGLMTGLFLSGYFAYKYTKWKDETRERIAADGIKADEIEWFKREMRPAEKRALKDIEAGDPLLADAYRETLASRLTASRIIRSSRKELTLAQQRQQRLSRLNSASAAQFQSQIQKDLEKLTSINDESKQMLVEAESRLQMIEAAAMRGGSMAGSDVALKKLASRAAQLPLALEAAVLHQQAVDEIESEESSPLKTADLTDQ